MERKEAIKEYLTTVQDGIAADQAAKNIKASGKSIASLRNVLEENGGKIYGLDYYYFLKSRPKSPIGRKPGALPPIEEIMQWIKDKGTFQIDNNPGSLKSLAFAIAMKIAKKGTDIYRGKRQPINIESIMEEAKKKLSNALLQGMKKEILEPIKNLPQ